MSKKEQDINLNERLTYTINLQALRDIADLHGPEALDEAIDGITKEIRKRIHLSASQPAGMAGSPGKGR